MENTIYINGTGAMYDYEYQEDIPWFEYNDKVDFVVISDGVTRIGDGCFLGCEMVDVDIPDSVEAIGAHAFMQCPYLFDITIPASVKGIGKDCFYDCPRLGWAEIWCDSVAVYKEAFMDCPELASVYFHGSIERMGENAFFGDTTTVYYPASDTSWDTVVGRSYGGTVTWADIDTEEKTVGARIETGKYSLCLPYDWTYGYEISGDNLTITHKPSASAGVGGHVFTLALFKNKSDYEYYPSYEVLGTLSGTGGTYDLVCFYATDVQFTQETQEGYRKMLDNKQEAFRYISGEGNYTFAFG